MTLPSERGQAGRPAASGPRGGKPRAPVSETIDPMMALFGLSAIWRLRTASDATPHASDVAERNDDASTADVPMSRHDGRDIASPRDQRTDQRAPTLAPIHATPPVADAQPVAPSRREVVAPPSARDSRSAVTAPLDLSTLDFDALRQQAQGCESCRLCETRKNVVFGVGDPRADWLFVGEGPGANEDERGEPFVGQAGQLLDNMLRALGLQRGENVFIANVVKCRPPGNRDPLPDEIAACEGYLQRQIALIQPRIIVALGRFAAQSLLRSDATIGALRRINAGGHGSQAADQTPVHHYEGVPVVVTYHPAYLLRTPSDKAKVWEDLCRARDVFAR